MDTMSSARCEPSKLAEIYVDSEDDDSYEGSRDYFRRSFRSIAVRRPRRKGAGGQATPKRSESLKVGKTETASMSNKKIGKFLYIGPMITFVQFSN